MVPVHQELLQRCNNCLVGSLRVMSHADTEAGEPKLIQRVVDGTPTEGALQWVAPVVEAEGRLL